MTRLLWTRPAQMPWNLYVGSPKNHSWSTPIENSQLGEHLAKPDWHCHHHHFKDSNPNIEWQATLDQAEKIGLGTRQYELKIVK